MLTGSGSGRARRRVGSLRAVVESFAGGRARATRDTCRMLAPWQRVLVLAPHTDDGEFGCGGTVARPLEAGAHPRSPPLSLSARLLPPRVPPPTPPRPAGGGRAGGGRPP